MKRYLFVIYIILSIGVLQAQNDTMYIMIQNSPVGIHDIKDIDSLIFHNDSVINDTLYLIKEGEVIAKYNTAIIDSIIFYQPISLHDNDTSVTDLDGNVYKVVKIGSQLWMAENLRTTKYNDGLPIQLEEDNYKWKNLVLGAYCWYNNDSVTSADTYGALYNWYSINTGKLCPSGWRVATDLDWTILIDSLGGKDIAGGKLKATGSLEDEDGLWHRNVSTNESGFTALPGGLRFPDGRYVNLGYIGCWWSYFNKYPDPIWHRTMYGEWNFIERLESSKNGGLSVRCVKGKQIILPKVLTSQAKDITQISSLLGGLVENSGGSEIIEVGIYLSQTSVPSSSGIKYEAKNIADTFTINIDNLVPGEKYHYQAYAINTLGEALGEENTFTTIKDTINYSNHVYDTISDIDGNVYRTIQIGDQVWMAENLKTEKFNDGSLIPVITDGAIWQVLQSPAFCWYDNDKSTNDSLYGKLYNWYTVNTNKLCPTGWHVPDDSEWETLINYLGGNYIAGGQLKSIGTIEEGNGLWLYQNGDATNKSGFTALPAGSRGSVYSARFSAKNYTAIWWSSNEISKDYAFKFDVAYNRSEIKKDSLRKKDGLSIRCIKSKEGFGILPKLLTLNVTNITQSTSIVGGILTNNDESIVLEKGIYWGTTANPSNTGIKMEITSITDSFTIKLDSLVPGETYHIQAYAINAIGETIGDGVSFTTKTDTSIETNFDFSTVSDIEGNIYKTMKIGEQIWMAENLKTTKYNDSSVIQIITDSKDWYNLDDFPIPAYCWYDNDPKTYSDDYGALYNWYVLETGKLCPSGWHVPSDIEWKELEVFIGMTPEETDYTSASLRGTDEGGKLKESGFKHWVAPNIGATNEFGFTGLPAGIRIFNGTYSNIGYGSTWWTSTKYDNKKAWHRRIFHDKGQIERYQSTFKIGYSVRCVKD